jgi:hypothetical protein
VTGADGGRVQEIADQGFQPLRASRDELAVLAGSGAELFGRLQQKLPRPEAERTERISDVV